MNNSSFHYKPGVFFYLSCYKFLLALKLKTTNPGVFVKIYIFSFDPGGKGERERGGGGVTPYNGIINGLCGEVPPKRGTFFRLEVYERVGMSRMVYIKDNEIRPLDETSP